jgi:hypothetical protein
MTHHNQTKVQTIWFLNLPLDEYIDNKKHKVWISNPGHWQQKEQSLNLKSKTPWSTDRRLKSKEKLNKVI